MNIKGTPGQIRVVPVDPNNQRISLDSPNGSDVAGTYNQVTVDSSGRVVSGKFIKPTSSGDGGKIVVVGSDGQICLYVLDPNLEFIKPADLTKPAICYSLDPSLNMMFWNTITHSWQ